MQERAGLTSSQRGTIAELYVAATLMAASGGRLSPFAPVSDDHGVDLMVLDKQTGRSAPVQVKAWLSAATEGRRTVQFDVRKATFRADGNAMLLALVLDAVTMSMEAAWLIPMAEVPGVAVERDTKYALAPSRDPSSRDRYSGFRHEDARSLAGALIERMSM